MEKHRGERLAEALREELEEIINYELEDPRIGAALVTEVLLSSDGRRARVRIALEESATDAQDRLAALDHARGHVRHLLVARLDMFRMPEIEFEADSGEQIGRRAKHLMRRMRKGRPRDRTPEHAAEGEKSPPR